MQHMSQLFLVVWGVPSEKAAVTYGNDTEWENSFQSTLREFLLKTLNQL